jgi:hypothetical protein
MDMRWMVIRATATLFVANTALAQTATQVVRFQVSPINQIAVSGNPAPLVIGSATAGSAPTPVSAAGTTYAITTNETNQKITASIDQPMPTGVTLEVTLAPPGGAASAGAVTLGTAGCDVITGISATNAASLPITYRLSAVTNAQMNTPADRTVTFTIVSGT